MLNLDQSSLFKTYEAADQKQSHNEDYNDNYGWLVMRTGGWCAWRSACCAVLFFSEFPLRTAAGFSATARRQPRHACLHLTAVSHPRRLVRTWPSQLFDRGADLRNRTTDESDGESKKSRMLARLSWTFLTLSRQKLQLSSMDATFSRYVPGNEASPGHPRGATHCSPRSQEPNARPVRPLSFPKR